MRAKTKPQLGSKAAWAVGAKEDNTIVIVEVDGDAVVATVAGSMGDDRTIKTAHLLAAAPDLLEAAKSVLCAYEAIWKQIRDRGIFFPMEMRHMGAFEVELKDAIARAKGMEATK